MSLDERFGAHNYHPLPVVIARGDGAWVTDVDGRRYLDMLSAYSALNFGHRNPRLIAAAHAQLDRLTLTSRAFHNDQLGPFLAELAGLLGAQMVLPMNSGAEAVESALKVARAWGYRVKGVPDGRAKIIVAASNFHGRTVTIVGFSTDPTARSGFGPFTPGFVPVPFGDAAAVAEAIDEDTVAVLVEPIQGEAGVIVPPDGYLRGVRQACTSRGVLLVADEIQSGLARTGPTLACEHDGVVPDLVLLGKALGGGIVPLSVVAGRADVLGVLRPGEHGSTFGGNPLAAAIGREVVAMLATGEYQRRSRELGAHLLERLRREAPPSVRHVRGRGLWAGVELYPDGPDARARCERLMSAGVLAKDTHEYTIRLAPPLVIEKADLDWATDRVLEALV
ncbi:MAG: ornithine--oxo-acid transaminase [Actinomycetes bacterium]